MGMANDSAAIFEVFDASLAEAVPDVCGLWVATSRPSAAAIAFATAPGETVDTPLWRAKLPPDPHLAHTHLSRGEARQAASQRALAAAAKRLERFIQVWTAGLAFNISSPEDRSAQPEQELSRLLRDIRAGAPGVSVGFEERPTGRWAQAMHQFQGIVEHLRRFVASYAWIETHMEDALLARTRVSWLGEVQTVWQAGLGPEEVRMHQRTVALALRSRETVVRTVAMAVQFAVMLSIMLGLPGGAVLVLPAAWAFINRIIAEFVEPPYIKPEVPHG